MVWAVVLALAPPGVADRKTLTDGLVTIGYEAGRERLAARVLVVAQRAGPEIRRHLGLEIGPSRIELVPDLAGLRGLARGVPQWALAIAIPGRSLIGVRTDILDPQRNPLAPTLVHEYVHLALGGLEDRAGRELPQWLNEGICEWYSGSLHYGMHGELEMDAALGKLIPFSELVDGFPADHDSAGRAYLQSQSFVSYIARLDQDNIKRLLQNFEEGHPLDRCFQRSTGFSAPQLEREWRDSITPEHPWLYIIVRSVSVFTILGLLVVIGVVRRRRLDRRVIAEWPETDPDELDRYGWRGSEDP